MSKTHSSRIRQSQTLLGREYAQHLTRTIKESRKEKQYTVKHGTFRIFWTQ